MSEMYALESELRTELGKAASRRLRRNGDQIPGTVYGGKEAPTAIVLDQNKVRKALENEGYYSHILTLSIGGKKEKVVLKDLQRHPFKRKITHMDFQRILANEKLTMHVPLHFVGDEKAPGVDAGGVISHMLTEVEIRCLPADLPEFIEVDTSGMKMNDAIHLSNLTVPKGVELVALLHDNDRLVCNLHHPHVIEEVAEGAPEAPPAEVPSIKVGADAEGEAAAEKDK